MGVPLLRGRAVEPRDLAAGAEPVMVVSRSTAALLWPDEDALGKCLLVGRDEGAPCARVVGIAAAHAHWVLTDGDSPMAWVPITLPDVGGPGALMVRVEGNVSRAVASMRRRVLALPGVRYATVRPMAEVAGRQMHSWRVGATVFSLFGLIALAVAAVGLYGVLAYDVAQRRREIGIRMALGASRGRVMTQVMVAALCITGAGLAAGLLIAAWATRALGSLLFHVSPREPAVFILAAAAILLTGVVAAFLPTWKATRVDPRECMAVD
jgi:hypothetical protein